MRRSGRSRFSGWRRSRALCAAAQAAQSGRMTLSASGAVGGVGVAVGGGLGLGVGQRGLRSASAPRVKRWPRLWPSASSTRRTAMQGRSAPSTSEQRSPESRLGQHRHDAVGEVGGVAAAAGLAVERASRGGRRRRRRRSPPRRRGRRGSPGRRRGGRRRRRRGRGRPDGSMVTKRQRAEVLAAAERRRAARPRPRRGRPRGNSSGMPCSWMAISETDRGADGSPRRAMTRARGRPWPRAAPTCSASTSSPSRAPARSAGRDLPVAVGALVDGGDAAAGLALVVDADDAARPHADAADDAGGERGVRRRRAAVIRPSRRSPAPRAGSSRRARIRMRGGAPSPSHSAGSAQRSPLGVGAGDAQHQDRRQLALRAGPGGGASRCGRPRPCRARRRFSSTLAAPLRPKARAMSRLAVWRGVLAQEGEDLVGGGQAVHGAHLARRAAAGTRKAGSGRAAGSRPDRSRSAGRPGRQSSGTSRAAPPRSGRRTR